MDDIEKYMRGDDTPQVTSISELSDNELESLLNSAMYVYDHLPMSPESHQELSHHILEIHLRLSERQGAV